MAKRSGRVVLSAVFAMIFVLTPQLLMEAFEIKQDSEVGAAIYFLVASFFYHDRCNQKASRLFGFLSGVLATIRVPVLPFSFLAINSWKSALVYALTFGFTILGLFRRSTELFCVSVSWGASTSVTTGWSAATSWIYNIGPNLAVIFRDRWWLVPLSLMGMIVAARWITRKNFFRYALLALGMFAFLRAGLRQERFFIGITGIMVLFAQIGMESIKFYSRSISSAGVIGVLIFSFLNLASFPTKVQRVGEFFSSQKMDLFDGEQKILAALSKGDDVFVDHRLRLNLLAEPMKAWSSKIHIVDLMNDFEVIPVGATFFTFCYDLKEIAQFGFKDWGDFGTELGRQCSSKTAYSAEQLKSFQNFRTMPLAGDVVQMQILKPIKLVRLWANPELKISSGFFKVQGSMIQEWIGGAVSNFGRAAETEEFSLSRKIPMKHGKYHIEAIIDSNYREPNSFLRVELDDYPSFKCALDSTADISKVSRMNALLMHLPGFPIWRDKYFSVPCSGEIDIPTDGLRKLGFRVESLEKDRRVRFHDIRMTLLK